MSSLFTFIGHWHPVVVHLPIGFIIAGLLLQLLAVRPAFASLRPAVPVLLLAGAFFGLISCCTGYILSTSGDYDSTLVGWHQWMGIGVTFLCFYVWSRLRQRGADRMQVGLFVLLFALVIVTGHLGGSLTHGADYLTLGGSAGSDGLAEVDSPIVDVQKAFAYAQVVRPILRDNCYGCHGRTKQKGGLRLDDSAGLFRGGKDGIVIRPGSGGASELIKRLSLPVEEEHHMPPKEKRQLNEREILLLHWWVDQGASMSRTVAEIRQPDSVRAALLSVQGAVRRVVVSDLPTTEVEAADEKAMEALRARGFLVMPVAQASHWLEVEAGVGGGSASGEARGGSAADDWVRLLLPLRKQLISLKLGHTGIGDSAMGVIGQCGELRSLDVSGDSVGDAGLAELKGLKELRVLNLVRTRVSAVGVEGLKGLEKLRSVYLYQTRVIPEDWAELRRELPKVGFDTGGYSLPKLVTDTAVVRRIDHKSL